jgi:hypothetical protein
LSWSSRWTSDYRLCLHIFLMKRGMISQGLEGFRHVSSLFMWFSTIKHGSHCDYVLFRHISFISIHLNIALATQWRSTLIDNVVFLHFVINIHLNASSIIHTRNMHSHTYTKHLIIFVVVQTPTGAGDRPLAEIRLNRVTMHSNPLAG